MMPFLGSVPKKRYSVFKISYVTLIHCNETISMYLFTLIYLNRFCETGNSCRE